MLWGGSRVMTRADVIAGLHLTPWVNCSPATTLNGSCSSRSGRTPRPLPEFDSP